MKKHMRESHKVSRLIVASEIDKSNNMIYFVRPVPSVSGPTKRKRQEYGPDDVDKLPINPILDTLVYCSLCEFSTKVRLNMVRHLQLHATQQPVAKTAPVNPVPHLETNEMHFDKMVNLASSSLISKQLEKQARAETITSNVTPETASRYPKYIPERQRLTCGAKGCSYISVDEGMLRCHWDTLHSGSTDFRCVHCPPNQHLDTSRPLTANRIIGHLKMHDASLYGCSLCPYYHYKKQIVENHVADIHKNARVLTVREETAAAVPAQSNAAPTMDLKPWQCGLCTFKSMLRPEVVDHCSKVHQSKMQFKCAYCPFRTSAKDNVTKHQTNSHPGKGEDVFYFYYREGSIPDEADGTPRWQLQQRQRSGTSEPQVKTEVAETSVTEPAVSTSAVVSVDLNLVKKEVATEPGTTLGVEESLEDLCKRYGPFCDPNGIKYKCSLCKIVTEDTKEAMQSHLFEELGYRKWGCVFCSYKAFHKTGLTEHVVSEHRNTQKLDGIELPTDINIEKWVNEQIKHQAALIQKNLDNLSKQRIIVEKPVTPTKPQDKPGSVETVNQPSMKDLEQALGPLGAPSNMHFSCPKCDFKTKDENIIKDHLETELSKIRWCCSNCPEKYQTYHEAQFHCRSVHAGQSARPVEAIRVPSMRTAWVSATIQHQKVNMKVMPIPPTEEPSPEKHAPDTSELENSLLVPLREERVATPEVEAVINRKRPFPQEDSDDERLVIDEPETVAKKKTLEKKCKFCTFKTRYNTSIKTHTLTHYKLKPYNCAYCNLNGCKQTLLFHSKLAHSDSPPKLTPVSIPDVDPSEFLAQAQTKSVRRAPSEDNRQVCLVCEKSLLETEVDLHTHEKIRPEFAKKGTIVVKCCICLALRLDLNSLNVHFESQHPGMPVNYAFFKLHHDTREINYCGYCNKKFKFLKDLKTHHNSVHGAFPLKYTSLPHLATPITLDSDDDSVGKRKADDSNLPLPKRTARKSTTKLPEVKCVAKKSTTKLPFSTHQSDNEGYSYYGLKPNSIDDYANLTAAIPICNTMVSLSLKKISEIINLNPSIIVKDIKKID